MHKLVQEEEQAHRTQVEKDRMLKQRQNQQRAAYGRAVRESFAPKVSEALKAEIESREERIRRKEAEIKAAKEHKYRDYLKEKRMTGSPGGKN